MTIINFLSLTLGSISVLAGSVLAEDIRVSNFKSEFQGMAPWCWAATARMALYQHGGIRKATCELVSEVLEKNCCGLFNYSGCYVGGRVEKVFAKNGYDTQYLPATMDAVVSVVRSNRVAILGLVSTNVGEPGHVAVVYGIENVDQPEKLQFVIYDPALGKMKLRPADILRRYEFDRRRDFRWAYTLAIL